MVSGSLVAGIVVLAAGMAGMYQSAAPTASVLVALAVLMPERVFYGFVYHCTPAFRRLATSIGLVDYYGGGKEGTVEVMHLVVTYFKVFFQAPFLIYTVGTELGWSTVPLQHGGAYGPAADQTRSAIGILLVLLGQLLNFMTYYRLTPCGVHYGAQFGYELPWCYDWPFGKYGIAHPQYIGMVIFVWGLFLAFAPTWSLTHPWFMVAWVETFAYGCSCSFLEEGTPLCGYEQWGDVAAGGFVDAEYTPKSPCPKEQEAHKDK